MGVHFWRQTDLGCRHMPRRRGKPRLRRSFALPEPGFPRDHVIPEKFSLGLQRLAGRAKAQCISVLRCQWGCTSCSRRTTGLGVAATCRGTGKPRLRRSFALPAPGLTYPKILSSLPDCGLSDAPLKLPGVFADQKGELLCHLEIEGTVQRFL